MADDLITGYGSQRWAKDLSLGSERQKGKFRACFSCGADPTHTGSGPHGERDYDNALFVAITGGYSQFIDPQDDSGFLPGHSLVLCHECAHEACDKLPWLAKLIEPASSHAHTTAYMDAHPDHYGWDYDMANGTYYPKLAAKLFANGTCTNCGHGEEAHARKDGLALWECAEDGCEASPCWPGKVDGRS